MTNLDAPIARRYHAESCFHVVAGPDVDSAIMIGAPGALRPAISEQDLTIEPAAEKRYLGLAPIALPTGSLTTTLPALDAIAGRGPVAPGGVAPDLATVAHLCRLTNGIVRRWTSPWGREMAFRAASCTGARYHLELYLVAGDLPGLAAGVYHYSPSEHALRCLRPGDWRGALASASGAHPDVVAAPLTFVVASEFWRNAWRYQERSYRNCWWDVGTMLANTLAVANSLALPASVVAGFADDAVNALVDIDGEREAAMALVPIGRWGRALPANPAPRRVLHATQASSPREHAYPAIQRVHGAGTLAADEVAAWRSAAFARPEAPTAGRVTPLPALPSADLPTAPIEDVIARRRSNRHYDATREIDPAQVAAVLAAAATPARIDALATASATIGDTYLLINGVAGLPQGGYAVSADGSALETLREADVRALCADLACTQGYTSEAQVNVYLLGDLEPVFATYGERGYRLAQLEPTLAIGRLQLAAHALGLGAVGSVSDDAAVVETFSPRAAGQAFLTVAVFGIPRRATTSEVDESIRFIKR
jgi:SagB-type dehydrogenase family enzyme